MLHEYKCSVQSKKKKNFAHISESCLDISQFFKETCKSPDTLGCIATLPGMPVPNQEGILYGFVGFQS